MSRLAAGCDCHRRGRPRPRARAYLASQAPPVIVNDRAAMFHAARRPDPAPSPDASAAAPGVVSGTIPTDSC